MKRRDRLDIIVSILNALLEKRKITNLVFYTKLNYRSLKSYLDQLLALGFIEEDDGYYMITDKGREFLRLFNINR